MKSSLTAYQSTPRHIPEDYQSKPIGPVFTDFLALVDGTELLYRNVGKKLSITPQKIVDLIYLAAEAGIHAVRCSLTLG